MEHNLVAWFEIPVNDMDRAKAFYEKVFNIEINVQDFGGVLMGWFPGQGDIPGASGSLVKQETYIPSQEGTLVYFHSPDLADELGRVEAAGGVVTQEKTLISEEIGYMGVALDTEGNRIALYSRP